jgi:phosphate acetyltransferase
MGNSLYISTTESGSVKALVALGTIELILRKATKVSFFRPVIQTTQAESKSGNLLTDRTEDIELILQHFYCRKPMQNLSVCDYLAVGYANGSAERFAGKHQIDLMLMLLLD